MTKCSQLTSLSLKGLTVWASVDC